MDNETPLIVTLSEFVDIFGGIGQISAIYVDTDDDQIRSQLQGSPRPLDILRNYDNIMIDDEYLVLVNGDYVLNKEKVFEAYGNYYVSIYYPIVPDEYAHAANELAKNSSDEEYMRNIAQYSNGCTILIKKTLDFNMKLKLAFSPKVTSNISGFAVFDYCAPESDIVEQPPMLELLAVVENQDAVEEILTQRITFDTIVYTIDKGLVTGSYKLYHTDKNGIAMLITESEDDNTDD